MPSKFGGDRACQIGAMMASSYRDLIAWQKAMDLVSAIYEATAKFPDSERYGLTSQLRRAAVSVPSNIAEGFGRRNRPDFQRFLRTARGSTCEIETQIEIAKRLNLLDPKSAARLEQKTVEVGRILSGLHASLDQPIALLEDGTRVTRRDGSRNTRH